MHRVLLLVLNFYFTLEHYVRKRIFITTLMLELYDKQFAAFLVVFNIQIAIKAKDWGQSCAPQSKIKEIIIKLPYNISQLRQIWNNKRRKFELLQKKIRRINLLLQL